MILLILLGCIPVVHELTLLVPGMFVQRLIRGEEIGKIDKNDFTFTSCLSPILCSFRLMLSWILASMWSRPWPVLDWAFIIISYYLRDIFRRYAQSFFKKDRIPYIVCATATTAAIFPKEKREKEQLFLVVIEYFDTYFAIFLSYFHLIFCWIN